MKYFMFEAMLRSQITSAAKEPEWSSLTDTIISVEGATPAKLRKTDPLWMFLEL